MQKVEILAPAGSYESLKAAITASADAVYIGGAKFGARAYADNLTIDQLKEAIDYTHLYNKKIYLTVNTLLKNNEIENQLFDYLDGLYTWGIDGLIVQDLGVLNWIGKNFSDVPIHASTQMTITSEFSANMLKKYNVSRIVPARELNLSEIKNIKENTGLEIETFVHGALCYCYSGQCLLSSLIGGRSGNRGRCAQPCRMPYNLVGDNNVLNLKEDKYLLSPKDLCTLEIIPKLIEASIDSFKIEGRMKKPEYVYLVVSVYRKYVDLYYKLGSDGYNRYLLNNAKEVKEDLDALSDIYNRGGFTKGYYLMKNGREMMSLKKPNHQGILVGEVESVNKNKVSIKLTNKVNSQDVLEVFTQDDKIFEFTLKDNLTINQRIIRTINGNYHLKKGQLVYRTRNEQLLQNVRAKLKEELKIFVNGEVILSENNKAILKIWNSENNITYYGEMITKAINQPLTEENVKSKILKTGNTNFLFDDLRVSIEGNVFMPSIALNELRRNALELFCDSLLLKHRRKQAVKVNNLIDFEEINNKLNISVYIEKEEYFDIVLQYDEVTRVYIDIDAICLENINAYCKRVHEKNKKIYLVLPYIIRTKKYKEYFNNREVFQYSNIDGFMIRNLEGFSLIRDIYGDDTYSQKPVILLDYNVYTMNKESFNFWNKLDANYFTSPIELNYKELKGLNLTKSEIIVYGHIPVMISAQCLLKTVNKCKVNYKNLYLTDRYNKKFYVKNLCNHCLNIIYNGQPVVLLNNLKEVMDLNPSGIRLNFTIEDKESISEIIKTYIDVFLYGNETNYSFKEFTRGHFNRGIE